MTRKIVWTDEPCDECERPAYTRRDGREYLYSYDGSMPVCTPRCANKSKSRMAAFHRAEGLHQH